MSQLPFSDIVFYVTAHQDDALLFRGEQLYADLLRNPAVRVVHIFTTAGDRGRTDGWWQAREQGVIAALTAFLAAATMNAAADRRWQHACIAWTTDARCIFAMPVHDRITAEDVRPREQNGEV